MVFEPETDNCRVTFKITLLVWKWCCSCISAGTLCPSRKTSEGVHGYGLHLLDVFSYRGWECQRDSEVMRSTSRQIGTVCHQLRRTAVCRWERSKGD